MDKEELVEWATIPAEELTGCAEALFNFRLDIDGIRNVLWQVCRKQVRKAYSHTDLALIDRGWLPKNTILYYPKCSIIPLAEALKEEQDGKQHTV